MRRRVRMPPRRACPPPLRRGRAPLANRALPRRSEHTALQELRLACLAHLGQEEVARVPVAGSRSAEAASPTDSRGPSSGRSPGSPSPRWCTRARRASSPPARSAFRPRSRRRSSRLHPGWATPPGSRESRGIEIAPDVAGAVFLLLPYVEQDQFSPASMLRFSSSRATFVCLRTFEAMRSV